MTDLARRIKKLRRDLKDTQTAFAERLGVEQSTVSRWERGAAPDFGHLAQMAKLAGLSIEDFSGLPSPDALPVLSVPVIGAVQAGAWVDAVERDRDDWYEVAVAADGRYPGVRRYGLEVRGPSMNRRYPEGSIVIVVKLLDLGRDPRHGERVVVQRRRRADDLMEATVKELRIVDGEPWLWPDSDHPSFQQPTPLHDGAEDDIVEIAGVVVGSYRPE